MAAGEGRNDIRVWKAKVNKVTVVLISGAPGTGKTYLARRLVEALSVVVLEKDAIKETLFDAVGEGDRESSKKLGGATFALLRMLVESHLKAEQSVVAEAAFWNEYERPWLDRMKESYDFDTLELHCHADPEIVIDRFVRRAESDERHSGHRSGMSREALEGEIRGQIERYGAITTGEGLVRIDTTDFEMVDYDAIVERVRAAVDNGGGS